MVPLLSLVLLSSVFLTSTLLPSQRFSPPFPGTLPPLPCSVLQGSVPHTSTHLLILNTTLPRLFPSHHCHYLLTCPSLPLLTPTFSRTFPCPLPHLPLLAVSETGLLSSTPSNLHTSLLFYPLILLPPLTLTPFSSFPLSPLTLLLEFFHPPSPLPSTLLLNNFPRSSSLSRY